MPDCREPLGRLVRETWVAAASELDDPKPSWLWAFDDPRLDDFQREVDMRIGSAVEAVVRRRVAVEIREVALRRWPPGMQREEAFLIAGMVARDGTPAL